MKKNIKEKVEMIRGQEDILVVRDKETTELKHRVRGLEEKVQRIQTEKDAMSRELTEARKQMDEDKVKLENNQQVSDLFLMHNTLLLWALALTAPSPHTVGNSLAE
jgi:uncharacterized membrane protein (DUF106 family)